MPEPQALAASLATNADVAEVSSLKDGHNSRPRVSRAHSWACGFARRHILSSLRGAITVGRLTITEGDATHEIPGDRAHKAESGHVKLTIATEDFWLRVLLSGGLGFSEAFMAREVEVSDLDALMHLWIDNQTTMKTALSSIAVRISSRLSGLFNNLFGQTRTRARLNVVAAYDQSNEFFKAFLSEDMMYSAAFWAEAEGGVLGDLDTTRKAAERELEDAQRRKIHHVCRKARVKPGDRVLEFGTGWGGFAVEAARAFGCEVVTLTLSIEQKKMAEERAREAGMEAKVRVHLLDYRDIPAEFEKAFDAFVAIEMIEHVGAQHHKLLFNIIDFALKAEGTRAVMTATTQPDFRYTAYQAKEFGRKYIWPNASLPSLSAIVAAVRAGAQGRLSVDSVENHTLHYARTLREWNRRFEANVTPMLVPTDSSFATIGTADYEAFKRKWRYLFAYASVGFATGYATSHVFTFVRPYDIPDL
ncbi:cyclopropane-fatty-acyl-phospholipid synthase [Mycena amicta]|nr:cyclopropane-fatty-acyl-phospholipid synthase [Mycena amicta]